MDFKSTMTIDSLIYVIMTAFVFYLTTRMNRKEEERRFKRDRKLSIFRALMKHRDNGLIQEYVDALNLIEVEFYDVPKVIDARKKLQEQFNKPYSNRQNMEITIAKAALISEIAKNLKINVEQLDILHGAYTPEGWVSEAQMRENKDNALLGVLSGSNPVRVFIDPKNE